MREIDKVKSQNQAVETGFVEHDFAIDNGTALSVMSHRLNKLWPDVSLSDCTRYIMEYVEVYDGGWVLSDAIYTAEEYAREFGEPVR